MFMRVEKGSFGLQIGGQEIDLVLLIMNDTGVQKLLNNKVTLGAEVSVAAGPVGRDARAATDAQLDAEICLTRARRACSPASTSRAAPSGPTMTTMWRCTAGTFLPNRSWRGRTSRCRPKRSPS